MIYAEFTQYSPVQDADITRISTCDDRGSEFFCLVTRARGKSWRAIRETALLELEDAMNRGDQPGEINVTLDA